MSVAARTALYDQAAGTSALPFTGRPAPSLRFPGWLDTGQFGPTGTTREPIESALLKAWGDPMKLVGLAEPSLRPLQMCPNRGRQAECGSATPLNMTADRQAV